MPHYTLAYNDYTCQRILICLMLFVFVYFARVLLRVLANDENKTIKTKLIWWALIQVECVRSCYFTFFHRTLHGWRKKKTTFFCEKKTPNKLKVFCICFLNFEWNGGKSRPMGKNGNMIGYLCIDIKCICRFRLNNCKRCDCLANAKSKNMLNAEVCVVFLRMNSLALDCLRVLSLHSAYEISFLLLSLLVYVLFLYFIFCMHFSSSSSFILAFASKIPVYFIREKKHTFCSFHIVKTVFISFSRF